MNRVKRWLNKLSCNSTLNQLVNRGMLSRADAERVWRLYGFEGDL